MTQDTPTPQDEPSTPQAPLGFGRAPNHDPVDAAIERHRAAYEKLARATEAVGVAETASRQAEDDAEAERKAASVADGAAWADLIATRPASMPGAVRLLRYVSTSPDVDSVEETQDLLRKLTAAVEAAETGEPQGRDVLAAGEPVAPVELDPALAVVAEFRAAWDALGAAIEEAGGVGVPEVAPEIEDREGEAYERLKTVRPTTPEGFRALAGAWAVVLSGERMGEPGPMHADHAADSLIAGAGACVPVVADAPISPALADLIAEHRDLLRQAEAEGLDDAAAEALDAKAWTLFRQACAFPAVGASDLAAKLGLAAPEIADGLEQGRTSIAVHAWRCLCADLRRFGLPAGPDPVDWTKPPPGFMASPAIEPLSFVNIEEGIKLEGRRLLELAVAEYRRRRQPRGQWQLDMRATEEGRRAARALQIETLAALAHPSLVEAVGGYRSTGEISVTLRDEDGRPLFRTEPETGTASTAPDPVHALIKAHQVAREKWEPLATVAGNMLRTDPGYTEAQAAADAAGKPEIAAYDALFLARPTTLAGVLALTEYLGSAIPEVNAHLEPTDGDRALSVIAAALRGLNGEVLGTMPQMGPDPVFAAIAASRRAELAMDMFQTSVRGWKPRGWQDRERALCKAQRDTREAVWRAVPTTQAGRQALVDYARFQVETHTGETGIIDNAKDLFEEILTPIAAAVAAERPRHEHDLTALSIDQLARLYGALAPFEDLIGRAENAPCFWNVDRTIRTPAGDIICQESGRFGRLLRTIAEEIERRQPATDDEWGERMNVLVRRAATLDGLTTARELLTEALAACKG